MGALVNILLLVSFRNALASIYTVSQGLDFTSCLNFLCPDILSALFAVTSGDEIVVSPGIYEGLNNTGLNPQRLSSSTNYNFSYVKLSGNGEPSSVIISGGLFNTRFLDIVGNSFVSVSNITFINFQLPRLTTYVERELELLGANFVGGTFAVNNATVSFEYVNFRNNSALSGAGIAADSSSITISNCNFIENFAGFHGGGFSFSESIAVVKNSTFYNNSAQSLVPQLTATGGAIYGSGVTFNHSIFIDCVFANNTADMNGGAITLVADSKSSQQLFQGGTIYFIRSDFTSNKVLGVEACLETTSCSTSGGAIYLIANNVTVSSCRFENNYALSSSSLSQGGAIFSSNILGTDGLARSLTTIKGSVFLRNSAGYGGAIYLDKQRFRIYHSSFDQNEALIVDPLLSETPGGGGAVFLSYCSSPFSILSRTNFTRNSALTGFGGAVYGKSSSFIAEGSIFDSNVAFSSYTNAAAGGAVAVLTSSSATVINCTFTGNIALPFVDKFPSTYSGQGGAIYAETSALNVSDSSFRQNLAISGQFDNGACGGAIYVQNTLVAVFTDTIFEANKAIGNKGDTSLNSPGGNGGAVYSKFAVLRVYFCVFEKNLATAGSNQNSFGGAIAMYFAPIDSGNSVIASSTFLNNSAITQLCSNAHVGWGGAIGVIGISVPVVLVQDCYFYGNRVHQGVQIFSADSVSDIAQGGALFAGLNSNISVTGSSFVNNVAVNGVGDHFSSAYVSDGVPTNNQFVFDSVNFNSVASRIKLLILATQSTLNGFCTYVTSYGIHGSDSVQYFVRQKMNAYTHVVENGLKYHNHRPRSQREFVARSTAETNVSDALVSRYSIAIATGTLNSKNCTFDGDIQIFVGDFSLWFATKTSATFEDIDPSTTNNVSPEKTALFILENPTISSPEALSLMLIYANLIYIYSSVGENATAEMIVSASEETQLRLSSVVAYESSITLSQPMTCFGPVFTTNTTIVSSSVASTTQNVSITFAGTWTVGYSLWEISWIDKLSDIAKTYREQNFSSSSQSSFTAFMTFVSCAIVVEGNVFINAPFQWLNIRTVDLYQYNSLLLKTHAVVNLEQKASWTTAESANVYFSAPTTISSQDTSSEVISRGVWTLSGGTGNLFLSAIYSSSYPERLQYMKTLGSTTSPVVVRPAITFRQTMTGVLFLYLNYTYQLSPSLLLPSNQSVHGQLRVWFLGTDLFVDTPSPNLQLYYGHPSAFVVIAYHTVSSVFDAPSGDDNQALQVGSSSPDLVFAMATVSTLDSTSAAVVQLTVTNIGCSLIFPFYDGIVSGSDGYLCNTCMIMNSSCSLCSNVVTADQTCAPQNLCPATFDEIDSCCSDCGAHSSCEMTNDYDFVCTYPSNIAVPISLSLSFTAIITIFGLVVHYVRRPLPLLETESVGPQPPPRAYPITLVSSLASFPIMGLSFISQMYFCFVCLSVDSSMRFGISWIVVKIVGAIWVLVSGYLFWISMDAEAKRMELETNSSARERSLTVFDWTEFARYKPLYTSLMMLVLVHPPLLRFLPWSDRQVMTKWTNGFPSFATFMQYTLLHAAQSVFVLIIQVEYALTITNFSELSSYSQLVYYFSGVTTAVSTMITIIDIIMVRAAVSALQKNVHANDHDTGAQPAAHNAQTISINSKTTTVIENPMVLQSAAAVSEDTVPRPSFFEIT